MNQSLQLHVVFTTDCEHFNVLMTVIPLPLEYSLLGNYPLGSSHFYWICCSPCIVLLKISESVNEPWAIRIRRSSHECIDETLLNLFRVFLPVLIDNWIFGKLSLDYFRCDSWNDSSSQKLFVLIVIHFDY